MKILSAIGLLFLLALGYGALSPQSVTAQQQSQSVQSVNSATMAVMASPSVSARFIDSILCNASSPACGTGQALYDGGVTYGIDPVFALAFFKHESSFGKYGIAAQNLGLGNIRCTAGYRCLNGFRAYPSWQAGYDDWYKLIRYYVDIWHKSTIYDIIVTYAPSSENNTQGYIQSIEESVSTWRQQAVKS